MNLDDYLCGSDGTTALELNVIVLDDMLDNVSEDMLVLNVASDNNSVKRDRVVFNVALDEVVVGVAEDVSFVVVEVVEVLVDARVVVKAASNVMEKSDSISTFNKH